MNYLTIGVFVLAEDPLVFRPHPHAFKPLEMLQQGKASFVAICMVALANRHYVRQMYIL